MNKIIANSFGIFIILIPLLLLLGLLFNNLSKRSFYPSSGEIEVTGLKSPVKIYFDDFGVPQIMTLNEEDAYFTLGYVHARDRLWQMDLTRRVAEGRLSEMFGINTINFDKLFRTIGINRFCYSWYNKLSPKTKQILDSYTKGVNSFIEANYNNLPVEFDALNFRPEPWKPEHSLMIVRLMGWDLNISWYTDYIIGEIINKVGVEKTSEIFPDSNAALFKRPDQTEDTAASEKENAANTNFNQVAVLGKDFFDYNEAYKKFFNINGAHVGSNSWVVSGEKSSSGRPMLANDPHLGLQAPSKWYEVYIRGGGLDVRGITLAGVPGIAIGNNRYISWGLTNLMNDDTDFLILKRDSADNSKYIYQGNAYHPDSLVEKIAVKDSGEVEFIVRLSKAGPIISELSIRGFADLDPRINNTYKNKLLTFKWTGFEESDEIGCFYKINTAKTWDDFINCLRDFNAPAMNFTYADINGNIGYHAAGKIPVRKTGEFKNYIYPAGDDLEWTGFVEFDKLPDIYNPKEGFIVTANTNPFDWLKTDSKDRYYISYLWESSSRYDRIREYLSSRAVLDLEDFKLIQNSYESPFAKNITGYIVEAFKNQNLSDENIKWCVERFESWHGEMIAAESIGSVYNTFIVYLLKNTYQDEMGTPVLHDFFVIQNLPYRSIQLLLKNNNSSWFDDINTANIETRDEIIRKSLIDAIEYLKQHFENPDIETWHWGVLHTVKFHHPLGTVEALDNSFNIGPFNIGGDQTTPNNTEYHFNDVMKDKGFQTIVGPSMRMITNMADIGHSYSINSTGQSGQPIHTNYRDQARLWLYGEYKNNTMSEIEMIEKNYSLLTLLPPD